jgi:ferredoxin
MTAEGKKAELAAVDLRLAREEAAMYGEPIVIIAMGGVAIPRPYHELPRCMECGLCHEVRPCDEIEFEDET